MNGPFHYAEAERIVGLVSNMTDALQTGGTVAAIQAGQAQLHAYIAEAQVHATLALAAAQADPDRVMVTHSKAWREVLR